MTLYDKFKNLGIDFSRLGLEQVDTRSDYLCTPKRAKVIAWEGVDGIHYCFVKGFDETVFAVNPSNLPGEHVHPLARNFEDFLRLLLACGGTAAVEQAWMWNRGEFDAFLETYPPDDEQRAVLDILKDKLSLTPMDDPYGYIKGVQSSFDYSEIPYSKEYYKTVPDKPETQEPPECPEWRVYFSDGFNGHHEGHDRPGKEIPINKTFTWGKNVWHILSVYACGKGLVVDLCMEIDPAVLKAFIDKWADTLDRRLTPEEMEEQMAENPTDVSYDILATVNGREMRRRSGDGFGWVPDSCRPESERDTLHSWEVVWIIEHYGLDPEKGWMLNRDRFEWTTKSKPVLKTLSLSLEQRPKAVPGSRFTVSGVGDTVPFTHPITGEVHILRVMEYENQEVDMSNLSNGFEYPNHCTAMSYVIEPELPRNELTVRDCGQGDSARPNLQEQAALAVIGGADGPMAACSIGIIGGSDGPTAILLANSKTGRPYSACSALRFETPKQIEWQMVFYHKIVEDMDVDLPLP